VRAPVPGKRIEKTKPYPEKRDIKPVREMEKFGS